MASAKEHAAKAGQALAQQGRVTDLRLAPERSRRWLAPLRAWLVDTALPLWRQECFNPQTGLFEEALTQEGAPARVDDFRVRVQARQIYVFSEAAMFGLDASDADMADRGLHAMEKLAWAEDGGWVHRLNYQGEVINSVRDLYDQAFVLFGLAAYRRAGGDEKTAERLIRQTQKFLDLNLTDGLTAGHIEAPDLALPRRQNPHMHLLEAYLALFEATRSEEWLSRAGRIVTMFRRVFMDYDTGLLNEYFDSNWRSLHDHEGQTWEPGHHFEWVWLLYEFERLSGEDLSLEREALFEAAHRDGRDPESGFAYDVMGGGENGSRRLWPQTELLRALTVITPAADDPLPSSQDLVIGLLDSYLNTPVEGLWVDQFVNGEPVPDLVPASTLYHLAGAALCMDHDRERARAKTAA